MTQQELEDTEYLDKQVEKWMEEEKLDKSYELWLEEVNMENN